MSRVRALRGLALALCLAGPPALAADGAGLFEANCVACHRSDASGIVGLGPSLKGAHWQKLGAAPEYVVAVLLHGMAGPIRVEGGTFTGAMPAQAALADADLAAIVAHLRGLQGLGAEGAPAAAQFAAARSAPGSAAASRTLRRRLLGE